MSMQISFGNLNPALAPSDSERAAVADRDTPLRIAILGDFSGRTDRIAPDSQRLSAQRFKLIDRDNFDEVLAGLDVELELSAREDPGPTIPLRFAELDDFHPDRLFERVALFAELRVLRQKLLDPETFRAAAEAIQGWATEQGQEPTTEPATTTTEAAPASKDLLDAVLAETEQQVGSGSASGEPEFLRALIKQVVAPYVIPAPDPRQPELVKSVDAAASHQMRLLLHHPHFQRLESLWRGLYLLVRRLETGRSLKLELFDITKSELRDALTATEELDRTVLFKLLVEQTIQTPGAQPWGLIVADFPFDATREDAELLGRVGKIAAAAGAPFVAGADPHLVRCESLSEFPDADDWQRPIDHDAELAWEALRALPEANYICLGLPRFLLRLPYGEKTSSAEEFAFEEMESPPRHQHYLWGNPAFPLAYLIAQAFTQVGWELRIGTPDEIDGLPLHVYEADGETCLQPCAEIGLTERSAGVVWDRGITPLWSIRGTDRVRVGPVRSLARASPALRGRWQVP